MRGEDEDLFAAPGGEEDGGPERRPLAERMRPRGLDEVVGQDHLLGPGRVLRRALERGTVFPMIFWGPPGSGKTALASLVARRAGCHWVSFSAVLSGVKEIRGVLREAEQQWRAHRRPTLLFVDEIHRFNKAQQDAFLPHVESGRIVLVGATTENPSFEINKALLSRSRVLVLNPLDPQALGLLVRRALEDRERGLGALGLSLSEEAERFLCAAAQGDARRALGALELAANLTAAREPGDAVIGLADVEEALQKKHLAYDKTGEEHYNLISAYIKSLRGSDPDAAMYWMVRMLEGGEDPLFLARRLVIFASEDVGNADPAALSVAVAAKEAVHFVGLPEAVLTLSQATTYLACASKSNAATRAYAETRAAVLEHGTLPVPPHLRNAPTALMRELGYGKGYRYPHDAPGGHVAETYLPESLAGRVFYRPTDRGAEREIGRRLAWWREARAGKPRRS